MTHAHLRTANVSYTVDGALFEGYTAYNADGAATGDKFPVILIVHQNAGLGSVEMLRAQEFAAKGYFAFAIDLYGAGVRPTDAADKTSNSSALTTNPMLAIQRAQGALAYAANLTRADTLNVSAVGICMGGKLVLEMARAGMPLRVAVAWHPGTTESALTTAQKQNLTASILVVQGLSDSALAIANGSWALFDELRASSADWQWRAISNTGHAFTHTNDVRYNAVSTQRAQWLTYQLLEEKMPTRRANWGTPLVDRDAVGLYVPVTMEVQVNSSDTDPVALKGWLAEPSGMAQLTLLTGPRPALLILPSMWGIGTPEKEWAESFASQGYVVYVADIYGNGYQPTDMINGTGNALAWVGNPPAARARLADSLRYLQRRADVSKVAVLGFCFGGIMANELARSGANVTTSMALHPGILASMLPASAGVIGGSLYTAEGALDGLFTLDQMQAWFDEVKGNATADAQLHVLGGTYHAYTDPRATELPNLYSEQATERSFRDVLAMLARDLAVPLLPQTPSPHPPPPHLSYPPPNLSYPPPNLSYPPPPPPTMSPPPPPSSGVTALRFVLAGALVPALATLAAMFLGL